MNKNFEFDKFGAKIFCRFCREKKFEFNHHPNDCRTCFKCGKVGHIEKSCGNPEENYFSKRTITYKTKSMQRTVVIDNSHRLPPRETVAFDLEKVRGKDGQMAAGWVSIYRSTKKKRHDKAEPDDLVYSAKIRQLPSEVDSYQTLWSGLSRLD